MCKIELHIGLASRPLQNTEHQECEVCAGERCGFAPGTAGPGIRMQGHGNWGCKNNIFWNTEVDPNP